MTKMIEVQLRKSEIKHLIGVLYGSNADLKEEGLDIAGVFPKFIKMSNKLIDLFEELLK